MKFIIALFALSLICSIAGAHTLAPKKHVKRPIPVNPIGVETISLGIDGPCIGFGHHNVNEETGNAIFGLSVNGVAVQKTPRDFLREWTDSDACNYRNGFNLSAGIQYGSHIAQNSSNLYVSIGYGIMLNPKWNFQIESGAVYEGFNTKRKRPVTISAWHFFPFISIEFQEHF